MNPMNKIISLVFLTLFTFFSVAQALPTIGEAAPEFKGVDYLNQSHSLAKYHGKIIVLEWLNKDCPFVRKHYDVGHMQKLQKKMTAKGVIWLSFISSGSQKEGFMTPEQASQWMATQQSAATGLILDTDGHIGHRYGAKTTPHMFVIDMAGKVAYMGAIDNKATFNPHDILGAQNYVEDAVDALLKGENVKIKTTQPYGCSIKFS